MAAEDEIAKTTGNLIQQLIGPWVTEKGLSWGETARISRLKNEFAILEKAKKIADEQGFKLRNINLKTLVPLLEGIGLEDDADLQDMWANLLINYVDSERNLSVSVYPEILRQLSSNEAKILKYLLEKGPGVLYRFYDVGKEPKDGPMPYRDEEINNLMRLSLLDEEVKYSMPKKDRMGNYPNEIDVRRVKRYYVTKFGKDFLAACSRES